MTELEDRVRHTENQVGELSGYVKRHGEILSDHGNKLDMIIQAVSGRKDFKPAEVISFVLQTVLLVGALCSGIVYIASNINGSRLAVLEYRMGIIQAAGSWHIKQGKLNVE
jgi:hypothetical protein